MDERMERIKELEYEIWVAHSRLNRPQYTVEDEAANNNHQLAVIADCERELKEIKEGK